MTTTFKPVTTPTGASYSAQKPNDLLCTTAPEGGCLARPTDYVQILFPLLNKGVSPLTKNRILSEKSIAKTLTNQVPPFPDSFGRESSPRNPCKRMIFLNPVLNLGISRRWGLSIMLTIHEGATGRGRNTAWWAGLLNCFWWCDREKGVAEVMILQFSPFAGKMAPVVASASQIGNECSSVLIACGNRRRGYWTVGQD